MGKVKKNGEEGKEKREGRGRKKRK